MNTSFVVSHSQEISVSFSHSQQFLEAAKLMPISSTLETQTTEDETPASRKRVTITKKETHEVIIRKEMKIQLNSSTDDSLWNTPSKKEVQGTKQGTAKTLKKGQTTQEIQYLPMTVNRNKHATKAFSQSPYVPETGSQKMRKSPVFGKRKFEEYEEDEEDIIYKEKTRNRMTPEFMEDTLKPLLNYDAKRVKMNEVEKSKEEGYEKIYLYNQTANTMLCYPVFRDKDLGFNGFIQTTLREAEVDNDCATDCEVMDKVKQWTMDDLFEGIRKHKEENEDEEDKEEAEERIKRMLFGEGDVSDSETENDGSSSEEYSSNYQEVKIAQGGNQRK